MSFITTGIRVLFFIVLVLLSYRALVQFPTYSEIGKLNFLTNGMFFIGLFHLYGTSSIFLHHLYKLYMKYVNRMGYHYSGNYKQINSTFKNNYPNYFILVAGWLVIALYEILYFIVQVGVGADILYALIFCLITSVILVLGWAIGTHLISTYRGLEPYLKTSTAGNVLRTTFGLSGIIAILGFLFNPATLGLFQ